MSKSRKECESTRNPTRMLEGLEVERVKKLSYPRAVSFPRMAELRMCHLRSTKLEVHLHSCANLRFIHLCRVVTTKIHIFKTWLVTEAIQNKIQVFVRRCLRRILRIFWSNTITNEHEKTWQKAELPRELRDINMEIRRRKFAWIGHYIEKRTKDLKINKERTPSKHMTLITLDKMNSTVEFRANHEI